MQQRDVPHIVDSPQSGLRSQEAKLAALAAAVELQRKCMRQGLWNVEQNRNLSALLGLQETYHAATIQALWIPAWFLEGTHAPHSTTRVA